MRTPPEWIGKDDNEPVPPRVRVRQFERDGGKCRSCGVTIRAGMAWQCDHVTAIANGGENRERNLQTLCGPCHGLKTRSDVAAKAETYRKRSKHLGVHKTSRPMPGSRASGWRKRMSGEVERRS